MVTCPACLAESAEGSRSCSSCGQALAARPPAAIPARIEERKVVSGLFCDLVGFTAMSEQGRCWASGDAWRRSVARSRRSNR